MAFSDQMRTISARVFEQDLPAVVMDFATEIHRSVVFGSEITGAPGQPVRTGALRASWILEFLEKLRASISTNLVYAPPIEDGVGPYGPLTLRSQVGGWHSVAQTVANADRLLAASVAKYARS